VAQFHLGELGDSFDWFGHEMTKRKPFVGQKETSITKIVQIIRTADFSLCAPMHDLIGAIN
jgi:hypothetical protein